MLFRPIRNGGKVWWGEYERTANPGQTTLIFGVKKGFRGYGVDAGNHLRSKRGFRGRVNRREIPPLLD